MSDPAIARKFRFFIEDPSKYDYVEGPFTNEFVRRREALVLRLRTADVYISEASEYSAKLVRAVLPVIVAEQNVHTIEFISYYGWKESADVIRTLCGVILRDKDAEVLLHVHGVSLDGSEPGNLDVFILDTLGVSSMNQKEIRDKTWPRINYSVVIKFL